MKPGRRMISQTRWSDAHARSTSSTVRSRDFHHVKSKTGSDARNAHHSATLPSARSMESRPGACGDPYDTGLWSHSQVSGELSLGWSTRNSRW